MVIRCKNTFSLSLSYAIKKSIYYTRYSECMGCLAYFLPCESFGIQEDFSDSKKTTNGLLGKTKVRYTPVHTRTIS